jgi:hypothetical protein
VEVTVHEMRAEHDALAAHIFVSRRQYRNMPDTKSGSHRETAGPLELANGLRAWIPGSARRMGTTDGCRLETIISPCTRLSRAGWSKLVFNYFSDYLVNDFVRQRQRFGANLVH